MATLLSHRSNVDTMFHEYHMLVWISTAVWSSIMSFSGMKKSFQHKKHNTFILTVPTLLDVKNIECSCSSTLS